MLPIWLATLTGVPLVISDSLEIALRPGLSEGPNTGLGRYSLAADTKPTDNVRIWYQVDLVTA